MIVPSEAPLGERPVQSSDVHMDIMHMAMLVHMDSTKREVLLLLHCHCHKNRSNRDEIDLTCHEFVAMVTGSRVVQEHVFPPQDRSGAAAVRWSI